MAIAAWAVRLAVLAILLILAWAIAEVLRLVWRPIIARAFTRIVEFTCDDPLIATRVVAKEFRRRDLPTPPVPINHTHPISANVRSRAVAFMREFVLSLNREEFTYMSSNLDQELGVPGQRDFYWSGDLEKRAQHDDPTGRIITMTDVDFHMLDLPLFLCARNTPIVLYTVIPTKVASSRGEATYYFDAKNRFHMNVTGGARYSHWLWDYSPDYVTVVRRFMGIPLVRTIYRVEKRHLDDVHALVCLAPRGTWRGPWAMLTGLLRQDYLRRLEPVTNGWAHLLVSNADGVYHSIGRVDRNEEATYSAAEYHNSLTAASISKHDATVTLMASWLDQDRPRALLMAAYARAKVGERPAYVASVSESVSHISSNVKTYGDDGDEKPSVQGFMSPLVKGGCFSHNNTKSNAEWGAEERITKLAKKKPGFNTFTGTCVREFIEGLCGPEGITPVSFDEVWEAQSRPTQRHLLGEGENMGETSDPLISSFIKKEAAQGLKPPRVISTIEPRSKLNYSRYMRALGAHVKQLEWYGFKTPPEIADTVVRICVRSDYVQEGDFSRMDGNISEAVRENFEKPLLRRLFPNDEHVVSEHERQYGQRGCVMGKFYDGGFARASGSPETSVFNTLLTAFIVYLRNRMTGLSKEDAFDYIGVCAGDDSLVPSIPGIAPEYLSSRFIAAARNMGQILKVKTTPRGFPCTFLSRVFNPWDGEGSSMTCPLRALSKIHSSPNMVPGVTNEDKCHEKGFSLSLTDSNTPVLGALSRKMMTVGKRIDPKYSDRSSSWWVQFGERNWPNECQPWMTEHFMLELPDFDVLTFQRWIESGHALSAPVCLDLEFKPGNIDLVVDGELVEAEADQLESKSQSLSGFKLSEDERVDIKGEEPSRRSDRPAKKSGSAPSTGGSSKSRRRRRRRSAKPAESPTSDRPASDNPDPRSTGGRGQSSNKRGSTKHRVKSSTATTPAGSSRGTTTKAATARAGPPAATRTAGVEEAKINMPDEKTSLLRKGSGRK